MYIKTGIFYWGIFDLISLILLICQQRFLFLGSTFFTSMLSIAPLPSQIISPASLLPPISTLDVLGLSKSVSIPVFTSIVHAFVCSCIDYCNSTHWPP